MIRRWSHINELNTLNTVQNRDIIKVTYSSADTILNTIMYLRRDFPVASQSFRKRWSRRKHFNQFLFLSNIMINWAKEYRFYKNYNRMLQNQFIFSNTYLAINLIPLKNSKLLPNKNEVNAIGSGLTYRIIKFFNRQYFQTRFFAPQTLREANWSYASYLDKYDEENSYQYNAPYVPIYYSPGLSSSSVAVNLETDAASFRSALQLMFRLNLVRIVELYKIMVKLSLFLLRTSSLRL